MKKIAAGILAIITVFSTIIAATGSSLIIGLSKMPKEIIAELNLKPEITRAMTTIIEQGIWIQIGIWLIFAIPMIGISILLRKHVRALCLTLGSANLVSGLVIAAGVNKIDIHYEAIEPVIQTIVKQMNIKAGIFIAIGSILAITTIIAHGSRIHAKQAYIQERPKKKLKGILKKGSISHRGTKRQINLHT